MKVEYAFFSNIEESISAEYTLFVPVLLGIEIVLPLEIKIPLRICFSDML